MSKAISAFVVLGFFIGCGSFTPQRTDKPLPTSPHFTVEMLSPGIWVVYAVSGAATGNAAVVDLGDATLVFDAFMSPEAAEDLRHLAEQMTGRKARYVVLSHWHNDHIRGAQAFADATIAASTRTRELILEREPPEIEEEKEVVAARLDRSRQRLAAETDTGRIPEHHFWISYYEAMLRSHPLLRLTPPTLTFDKRLIIHGRSREVQLLDFSGHTGSDTILWLPAERIAFMGDLLFVGHHPYLPDGDPDAHRKSLRAVKDLGPRYLLPGHGPVSGPESLDGLIAYIDAVEATGVRLMKEGASDEQAGKASIHPTFAKWWYGNFYPSNVRFMLRRARASGAR